MGSAFHGSVSLLRAGVPRVLLFGGWHPFYGTFSDVRTLNLTRPRPLQLQPGSYVRISDLSQRPELNGTVATVICYRAPSRRYQVELEDGKCVLLRSANLTVVTRVGEELTAGAGSGWIDFDLEEDADLDADLDELAAELELGIATDDEEAIARQADPEAFDATLGDSGAADAPAAPHMAATALLLEQPAEDGRSAVTSRSAFACAAIRAFAQEVFARLVGTVEYRGMRRAREV